MKSYLNNQKQCVVVNDVKLTCLECPEGVLQGSILCVGTIVILLSHIYALCNFKT